MRQRRLGVRRFSSIPSRSRRRSSSPTGSRLRALAVGLAWSRRKSPHSWTESLERRCDRRDGNDWTRLRLTSRTSRRSAYFGRNRARPASSTRSLLPVGEDDRRWPREGIGRKTPAFELPVDDSVPDDYPRPAASRSGSSDAFSLECSPCLRHPKLSLRKTYSRRHLVQVSSSTRLPGRARTAVALAHPALLDFSQFC